MVRSLQHHYTHGKKQTKANTALVPLELCTTLPHDFNTPKAGVHFAILTGEIQTSYVLFT